MRKTKSAFPVKHFRQGGTVLRHAEPGDVDLRRRLRALHRGQLLLPAQAVRTSARQRLGRGGEDEPADGEQGPLVEEAGRGAGGQSGGPNRRLF